MSKKQPTGYQNLVLQKELASNGNASQQALYETSLSRIWQHVEQSKNKSFAILTSWRQSKSKNENVKDFAKLKAELRSKGLGFVTVNGHWKECQDPTISYNDCPKDQLVDAVEPSLFVMGSDIKTVAALGLQKFQQDAIVYSGPETDGKIVLVFKDMSTQPIGDFKPQALGQAFSELKKSRAATSQRYFKFEGVEYKSNSYIESLIEQEIKKALRNP